MIKLNLKIVSLTIVTLVFTSCKTTPPGGDVSSCPSVEREPVSSCRAEAKCKSKKTEYGIGLGYSTQARENLATPTQEMSLAQSPTTDNYANCIQQSLKEQQELSSVKTDEKQIQKDNGTTNGK